VRPYPSRTEIPRCLEELVDVRGRGAATGDPGDEAATETLPETLENEDAAEGVDGGEQHERNRRRCRIEGPGAFLELGQPAEKGVLQVGVHLSDSQKEMKQRLLHGTLL
jgi:hypothetical protein